MKSLSIQLQPDLAPELDISLAKLAIEELLKSDLVVNYAFSEGNDDGPYLNFTFSTLNLEKLWLQLNQTIYTDSSFGISMKNSSMAMCEGSKGWDNYLLLHHYDPSIDLDEL